MSFFSEINGFKTNNIYNKTPQLEEEIEDYSQVDFCENENLVFDINTYDNSETAKFDDDFGVFDNNESD